MLDWTTRTGLLAIGFSVIPTSRARVGGGGGGGDRKKRKRLTKYFCSVIDVEAVTIYVYGSKRLQKKTLIS